MRSKESRGNASLVENKRCQRKRRREKRKRNEHQTQEEMGQRKEWQDSEWEMSRRRRDARKEENGWIEFYFCTALFSKMTCSIPSFT